MMKKILLIAAAFILAISCSKSPTDPNDNNNDTGDGGIIDEGSGTKDPTTISDFLKNHSGRYYMQYGELISINVRIENGKMYNGNEKTEADMGKVTLSGNKLQVEITGIESDPDYSRRNSYITVLNFINNGIQIFPKLIYKKEKFSIPSGYVEIQTINEASTYSGNYYQWYRDTSSSPIIQAYVFAINEEGKIYGKQWMKDDGVIFELNGNILSYKFTKDSITTKYSFIMEATRAINDSLYNDDIQYFEELKKSDLLTPYTGIYSGNGITLTVDEANALISTISVPENSDAILNGKTLTIYENQQQHTIVFSDNNQTATYTKPDGTGTVTLTKQGA